MNSTMVGEKTIDFGANPLNGSHRLTAKRGNGAVDEAESLSKSQAKLVTFRVHLPALNVNFVLLARVVLRNDKCAKLTCLVLDRDKEIRLLVVEAFDRLR